MMENTASRCNTNSEWDREEEEEEQDDDVLSLCNLTMQESSNHSSALSSPLFQFSNLHDDEDCYFSAPEIIFCGKIKIIQQEEQTRRPSDPAEEHPGPRTPPARTSSYQHHDRKVNMTALTSMSAKSRRRMFMFGPVKFKPEMDLSAIKERKGKRLTTLLSPEMMWDGGKPVAKDGGAAAVEGGKRSQWGIVKATLKGRAHLSNVLARSFGFGRRCIIPAAATALVRN